MNSDNESYFTGKEIAAVLKSIQEEGFLRRPADDPLMVSLVNCGIVSYRPFYEAVDDRCAFRQTIEDRKTRLVAATQRNDFNDVIRLATGIVELGAALDDRVWAATVNDLTTWIELFADEDQPATK